MKQPTPETSAVVTEKNYRNEMLSRLNSLIIEGESFKVWLNDTSKQFRDVILLLANKPSSGSLVNDVRVASIDLANGEVSAISGQVSNIQNSISRWQKISDLITTDPSLFVSKADFDSISTIGSLQDDILIVRGKINSNLSSVTNSLKY